MKKILFFQLRFCGHCRKAKAYLDSLLAENPAFKDIEIEHVDEGVERERAKAYDYFYVPTFYIEDEKVHEGPVNRKQLEGILQMALAED